MQVIEWLERLPRALIGRVVLTTFFVSVVIILTFTGYRIYTLFGADYFGGDTDVLLPFSLVFVTMYTLVPLATFLGVITGLFYAICARSLGLTMRFVIITLTMLLMLLGLLIQSNQLDAFLGANSSVQADAATESALKRDREKVSFILHQIDRCNVSRIVVDGATMRFSYNTPVATDYETDNENPNDTDSRQRPRLQRYLAMVTASESRCGKMAIDGGGDYIVYDIVR